MSEDRFEEMALRVLSPPGVTLGKVDAYTSAEDRVVGGPRAFDHCGYGQWRSVVKGYTTSDPGCPDVKEAIKIGGSIVVRSVDGDCRPSSRVLVGDHTPLHLAAADTVVEVLDLNVWGPGGSGRRGGVSAEIYVRSSAVSRGLAIALLSKLRDLTGAESLSVTLRPDAWFVTDCGFPSIYPFEDRGKPPTVEQLDQVPLVACFAYGTNGKVQCPVIRAAR